MQPKPGSNMGAMTGSPDDDKSDKETTKPNKNRQQQVAAYHDAELGCGIDEQIHLLNEKHLELPSLDWLNLPSHLLGTELSPVGSDNDAADPHVPANLFFWSDYHTDFDGSPNYKEIVNPKYDAILLKCATAPADWQVPDLQLPMAKTYDLVSDLPSSSHHYPTGGKTATSLPCIPTAFEPISSASRDGSGSGQQPSSHEKHVVEETSTTTPRQSAGGGAENYSYQRAFLQRVNVSYQTATSVQWQRATSVGVQECAAVVEETEKTDRTEAIPWELPEEEVKALRERSQQYLEQFDYKPTLSRTALVRNSTSRKDKVGNNGKTSQARNTNPDIEYFKQQLAPILTTESPSHGAPDTPGPPWPSDGDDDEEDDDGYYPELLEDPRPKR